MCYDVIQLFNKMGNSQETSLSQLKGDEAILMIASASDNSPFPGRISTVSSNESFRGVPLKGVKYDISRFKQKFRHHNLHSIETSKECNTLLTKQYVVNWLANNFKNAPYEIYLFYTGHGHENGDWAIQTLENPEADRLSFQEIADIWMSNRMSQKSQLYIFMDSCHSGHWCIRAGDMDPSVNISVVSSCSWDQRSRELSVGGGMFNQCILATETKNLDQDIRLLLHFQTPYYFINNMDRAQKLQANHIKILQKSITNIKKLFIRPNRLDSQPQSRLQTQQSRRQSRSKSPSDHPQPLQPPQQPPQQQKLQAHLLKITKSSQWSNLQNKSELYLQGEELEQLPEAVGKFVRLEKLVVFGNRLRDLPACFGNLKLRELWIGDNLFREIPGFVFNIRGLRYLDVSGNNLGKIDAEIYNMKSLTHLNISSTNLTTIPQLPPTLHTLKTNSNFLQTLPQHICSLQSLHCLYIHNNSLKLLPQNMYKLSNLQVLWMHRNKIMKYNGNLGALGKLRVVKMAGEGVMGLGVGVGLGDFGALEELFLDFEKPLSQQQKVIFMEKFRGTKTSFKWTIA